MAPTTHQSAAVLFLTDALLLMLRVPGCLILYRCCLTTATNAETWHTHIDLPP
jgi:hypothetical protein